MSDDRDLLGLSGTDRADAPNRWLDLLVDIQAEDGMISDAEIDVEVEQILARIDAFRHRIAARPEYREATSIGFLDVGLEAAENAIRAGHQCMQSTPGVPMDLDVEYAMSPMVGFV